MNAQSSRAQNEVDQRESLAKYCPLARSALQDVSSATAQLAQLSIQASTAYEALQSQVLGMEEFFSGAPAAASDAASPSWMPLMQEALRSTQQLEQQMLDTASNLVNVLVNATERSADASAASLELRGLAAAKLNRRHNDHVPALLHLPDSALEAIARKMGKRARLLCHHLKQAYGSPGAILNLCPDEPLFRRQRSPRPSIPYTSIIQSWQYPVRRLVLGPRIAPGGPCCQAIAAALPSLRELECQQLRLEKETGSTSPAAQLTALTSLHVKQSRFHLEPTAAFAPQLRSLQLGDAMLQPGLLGGSSALLRGLHSLQLAVFASNRAVVLAAMECLTGLTLLSLDLTIFSGTRSMPDAQSFTRALSGLPLLASLKVRRFNVLGEMLGAALQQPLQLRHLHLNDEMDGPELAGRLPDVGAMPHLRSLVLDVWGAEAMGSAEVQQMFSGGGVSLRSLELDGFLVAQLPAVVANVLALLSQLTMLRLTDSGMGCGRPDAEQLLCQALGRNTQLQHLELHLPELESVGPWLGSFTAGPLTYLQLGSLSMGLAEAELAVLGSLTRLRTLALQGDFMEDNGCKMRCMDAAWKLPLLEQLRLGEGVWSEEEVQMLLPPPGALKRLVLYVPDGEDRQQMDAVGRLLEAYDVEVAVRCLPIC